MGAADYQSAGMSYNDGQNVALTRVQTFTCFEGFFSDISGGLAEVVASGCRLRFSVRGDSQRIPNRTTER